MLHRVPAGILLNCPSATTEIRVSRYGEVLDESRTHHMPNGSVCWYVDREHSKMRIFSETEPHPADWKMVVGYLRQLCPGAELHEHTEDGIVVFEAAIADLASWPLHTDDCPQDCMHLDPGIIAA